ncbi:MAG: GTPase domain-containing protein [Burkholderiaceae bacterium]
MPPDDAAPFADNDSGTVAAAVLPVRLQLALISHTNVGKTTLARTLLGRDIGEVRDAPHITETADSHVLVATDAGDELRLWDTPGFGDSVRLAQRLRNSEQPVGWFLREVWDRNRDRTFWLSQQALRAARDHGDVVLYLANASEDPNDVGYVEPEMQILQWLGKPVLVLLNQTGRPKPADAEHEDVLRWRARLTAFSVVRQVLPLDAFARCWVHERVLLDAVGKVLPAAQTAAYQRLVTTWQTRNEERFDDAMELLSNYLLAAARDVEAVSLEHAGLVNKVLTKVGVARDRGQQAQQLAMNALAARLDAATVSVTQRLIALHGLEGSAAAKVDERLAENFAVQTPADPREAGFWGAIASGAATGLSADLLSGGLTVGGGLLIGGVVGALTAAGAALGFNRIKGVSQPTVRFAEPFLQALAVTAVLRYLAVAHYGRGRGDWVEGESPAFWQTEAEAAVAKRSAAFGEFWLQLRAAAAASAASTPPTAPPRASSTAKALQEVLSDAVWQTLTRLYPDAIARRQ